MRALLTFALLAAVGCGSAPSGRDDPKPDGSKPGESLDVAFDPNSAENTLAWAASIWRQVDRAPKGNVAAIEEARKKARADVEAGAKGKSVRWPMIVKEVTPESLCVLRGLERNDDTREPHSGWKRFYSLGVGAVVPKGSGDYGTDVLTAFPSSPPKAPWVKTAGTGTRVLLVGKVASANLDQSQTNAGINEWRCSVGFVLADAHVEKP